MIEVCIYRNINGSISKYWINGHSRFSRLPKLVDFILRNLYSKQYAGYPEAGRDVVCAAVSSIAQTPVIGLKEVVNLHIGLETDEKTGYLECILPEHISAEDRIKADIILETMYLSLKNVEKQFSKLVKVVEMEV